VPTVQDIIRHVERAVGHPLGREEGVHHGSAEAQVSSATVAWMATPGAISAAGARSDDLLIAHESLYYPYDVVVMDSAPPGWRDWPTNRARRELLDRHGIACLRLHSSADELCVLDAFAATLGLGAPAVEEGLVKVYEIEPCPLAELVEHVKRATGMPALRVSAPRGTDVTVRRVGLPWGGMGLFVNVSYQQELVARGCDCLVAGETDDYGFRFARELGIPTIETSHEVSENPGLRELTRRLAGAFPSVRFAFHENACPWTTI
jgi:putative NIF3 family GTP cyclohydrolase 1 type 2